MSEQTITKKQSSLYTVYLPSDPSQPCTLFSPSNKLCTPNRLFISLFFVLLFFTSLISHMTICQLILTCQTPFLMYSLLFNLLYLASLSCLSFPSATNVPPTFHLLTCSFLFLFPSLFPLHFRCYIYTAFPHFVPSYPDLNHNPIPDPISDLNLIPYPNLTLTLTLSPTLFVRSLVILHHYHPILTFLTLPLTITLPLTLSLTLTITLFLTINLPLTLTLPLTLFPTLILTLTLTLTQP